MSKVLSLLGFDPMKHSVKVEMMAGLTTLLTMSYILAVNPIILVYNTYNGKTFFINPTVAVKWNF